jgi:murein L,D-transpeptidase YcbB/YkuD
MRAGVALLTIFAAGALLGGATRTRARAIPPATAPTAQRADSIRAAIREQVSDGAPPANITAHQWQHVQGLYRGASYAPLWIGDAGLLPRARSLIGALSRAGDDGMSTAAYPLAALDSAVGRLDVRASATNVGLAARADILLTSVFAAFGEHMLRGQIDPRRVQPAWHIAPADLDVDSALVRVLRAPVFESALVELRPEQRGYDALRESLARYRRIVAAGGWPRLAGDRTLRLGDTTTEVALLRRRLHAEGLLADAAPATSGAYDAALGRAVATFQARHGLEVDSVVGPATRRSLNVTAERRVAQIAANLERFRWLPHDLGGRYVLVNIPAFYLGAYDQGQPVLQMKVVVGRDYGGRATPIFSDSMSYLIFDPYWNVPESIAEREILPKATRDPSYLTRNRFEVVRGWGPVTVIPTSSLSRSELAPGHFRYRLRQKPGPGNALGRVKFIFPNDYNVYLHDTPEDQLFSERVRAFSHGCIRVEKPAQLAAFVLGPQGWTATQAEAAMNAGMWRRVTLTRKLPVYIAYFTAFDRNGELAFRPDVYDQDDRLIRALGPVQLVPGASPAAERLARRATR